ncbi:carboxylesterase family protein [Arthrobacter sp. SLBN-53]|uniref:carboxylesterase/lipase family protein n=1 Tax=Arthrobacter sp. SLBN-53 TaxID=2768412 RepID=UPI001168940C|nr:carboxylesterase family protein [Arthrobacter sp. SLBN-53]TQK27181.1 para-nitrobenzyl esterase [Arthrobacter sp. SLBN-53]
MPADPHIRTGSGVVRGRWDDDVAVFRGIPYAQPPVGAHRFRHPVAPASWDGVREVAAFGPPSPQAGTPSADINATWLTLNVWSPSLGATGLPVMVWIHGGRYIEGHSANPHHNGVRLAAHGVVLVSLNYRLGAEGFAEISGAPNNRGLLDQIAALQWVHDNITAFGGDPHNVTVFGQSAGGGSIAALLTMPASAGLFTRAIAQSMPGTFFTERLAAAVSDEIAGELGVQATTTDLQRFSPQALAAASERLLRKMPHFADSWGPMAMTPTPFSPIVDGTTLPDAPWRALADGAARSIDLLVGHTRDEYSLFHPWRGRDVSDELLTETVQRLAHHSCQPGDYRAAYPDASSTDLYETVNADWLFRMPCEHLAAAHLAGGGTARLYEMAWSFNPADGASHSLDMLLVFGTFMREDITSHPSALPGAADEYEQVSRTMRTDWVDFATRGAPTWPSYERSGNRTTRVYNTDTTDRPYPEEVSRRLWAHHRFDALDLS